MVKTSKVEWQKLALENMLGADFDERWQRATAHRAVGSHGYDAFGFCPDYVRKVVPAVALLYRHYFRVDAHDIDRVPQGRALLIANHSGQLPFDGMMIAMAMLLQADPPRFLRSMVEHWVPTLPFVSTFFTRCGQVVGTPANFERLLDNDETILVFPEGSRGIAKTWRNRYRLQPFGNGFMRLAIKGRAPIVPIAVVGAEEQQPAFFNLQKLGKVLGAPAFPITPTFPWLGPLGLLPYPSKYDIYFGEPLLFDGLDNDDDAVIRQKVELVKDSIQTMIEAGRKRRKGFLG